MHRAFDTLFHHCASHFVRIVNIAVVVIIVRVTSARADKFRKAIPTFFTGEQAGIFKLFPNVRTDDALAYAPHTEVGIPYKLMAGIQIAVGRNGEILVACAARGNPLGKARTALQIHVEMEEIKAFPFRVFLQVRIA